MSANYLVDRSFRTLYACIGGAYFLEAVIQGGAFTVGWFVDQFADPVSPDSPPTRRPEEVLEARAAKVPPGSLGLVLVPYWNHAMTPYWDAAASGITVGWTGAHGREHFYRAILEGIAFEQRLVGDGMMTAKGRPFDEYVALGGGSRSDLWCQILADVTDVPVVRCATPEATCLGAGILAATAARWYPNVQSAANTMTGTAGRFIPNPEARTIYERLYSEVYRPLFPTLQPLIHRLAELTQGLE
jgi:xylulokinase